MVIESILQDNGALTKKIAEQAHQNQVNLNVRLDNMYFKDYTLAAFNASAPHPDNQISFVTNGTEVLLYKGDTLLSGSGDGIEIFSAYQLIPSSYGEVGEAEQWLAARTSYGNKAQAETGGVTTYYTVYSDIINGTKHGEFILNNAYAILDSTIDVDAWENNHPLSLLNTIYSGNLYPSLTSVHIVRFPDEEDPTTYTIETLSFTISLSGVSLLSDFSIAKTDGALTPTSSEFYYKIIISNTTNNTSRTTTRQWEGSFNNYTANGTLNNVPLGCGLILGCKDVVLPETPEVFPYGDIIVDPVMIFGSRAHGGISSDNRGSTAGNYLRYVKDTPEDPIGLYYDISTGAKLPTPHIMFANPVERRVAWILSLPESETVPSWP